MKNLKGLFGVGLFLLSFPIVASATISTQSATINGDIEATVDVGSALTASVAAKLTGSGAAWNGTKWLISTSTPGSMSCIATTNQGNGSSRTATFSITAPIITGIYNVYFEAMGGATCLSGTASGGLFTLTNALTVKSGGAASAVVSANNTSAEVGTGTVTLTITLRDQYGNLVSDGTSVTLLSSFGSIGGSGDSSGGVITRTLESDQLGTITLNISGLTMSGDTSINFQDTTAPTITLLGSNPQTVLVGQSYTELGATVSDNYDTGLSATIDASALDTNTLGSYSVTYNVTDSNSNAATQVTRTVNVVDQEAPVITLLGANPQTINVGSAYTELGATVSDNVDTGLAPTINASAVDINTVGSYVVTYDAVDSSANPATQVTRTVNVIALPPTITNQASVPFPGGHRRGGQVLGAFIDASSGVDTAFTDPASDPATTTPATVNLDPKVLSELSSIFSKLSGFLQQQIALAQAASRE